MIADISAALATSSMARRDYDLPQLPTADVPAKPTLGHRRGQQTPPPLLPTLPSIRPLAIKRSSRELSPAERRKLDEAAALDAISELFASLPSSPASPAHLSSSTSTSPGPATTDARPLPSPRRPLPMRPVSSRSVPRLEAARPASLCYVSLSELRKDTGARRSALLTPEQAAAIKQQRRESTGNPTGYI